MKRGRWNRRGFLRLAAIGGAGAMLAACRPRLPAMGKQVAVGETDMPEKAIVVQTVSGPISPDALGLTLVHEHVMVDFIGADRTGPHRWDRDQVVQTMLPYLQALRQRGVTGFVDCSPMYLGRDPLVLARLAELTGLHILTNTGLYKEPYLPREAFDLQARELADEWVREWEEGIDHTEIKPGFIKIAVNPGPLLPIQQTIVRAAAIAHLATGL